MTPEQKKNVEAWIEALESGEYKQGKKSLRGVDQSGVGFCFCCLGVLTELNNIERIREFDYLFPNGDVRSAFPPAIWFEEITGLGSIIREDLAGINDNSDDFSLVIRKIKELIET